MLQRLSMAWQTDWRAAIAANPTVDLHCHSTYSDGSMTPAQLAERARSRNVTALAITDHDTLRGSDDKRDACRAAGVEWVCGVELSCEHDGRELHILSLFADPASSAAARLDELSAIRSSRMDQMLERLERLGIRISKEELDVGPGGVYGRPHIARALVARGFVKSVNEAFARYLYDGGPVYVPKQRLTAAEGIALAKDLGGLAIAAHPGVSGMLGALDALRAMGIDGIEAYHPKNGAETVAKILRYCKDHGLAVSGGSDFHGPPDRHNLGCSKVPPDVLEALKQQWKAER